MGYSKKHGDYIDIFYVFCRKVPYTLFLDINQKEKRNINKISRDLKTTYNYSSKLFTKFNNFGLITKDTTNKRRAIVNLTQKGEKLQGYLRELKRILNDVKKGKHKKL